MSRIFKERGITADRISVKCDHALFSDAESHHFSPTKMATLVTAAEKHLETPIPLLPLSSYLEFRDNGNRSRYEAIYFKRRDMALTLSLAESYERKGRFTAKLADVVWAIMEESTWIIPAHLYNSPTHGEFGCPPVYDSTRIHGIDLFSAGTAGALTAIYTLSARELDSVSPIIREKLLHQLRQRIVIPYLNCSFWWTGERGNSVNNWCPWIVSNILHAASVAVADEYTMKRVLQRSLDALDHFTAEYMPDGGCSEGPSYWGAAGASYFDCLELLYDISKGTINVYDHPLVRSMCEYIVKFNICKNRFVNFADCPPKTLHDGAQIRRMGEKCGSASLIAFGDTMATLLPFPSGLSAHSRTYRYLRNLMTDVPAHTEGCAERRIWFPDLKVMIARESTDPARGIFVAVKGGNNDEQHNHNDVGNVIVYHNGNPVLIDTGAGEYTKKTFSSQRYELWYMQSNYHNLPAFGGVAQKNGKAFVSSEECYRAEDGSLRMELAHAYPAEADLRSFVRTVVLNEENAVVITDEIRTEREQEVDFRYMSCAEPRLLADGKIALAEGRIMEYDPRLACEIEAFAVCDPGIERNWQTDTLWRIHFRASCTEGKFVFTVR